MSQFLAETGALLEESLRYRVARQAVLASNLANVDTPGYRRADLAFTRALDEADLRLDRTHASHRANGGGLPAGWRLERDSSSVRPDGNGVEFDAELVQVSRNSGAFQEHAQLYARLLAMVRFAISGDGA